MLVDIGSVYCGACKKVKPVLETIRTEYGASLKVVEIDISSKFMLLLRMWEPGPVQSAQP